jgi:putative redox protein
MIKKIQIKQVEGLTFLAKGETNHWVPIDGPQEFHGSGAGSRPKELLLMALGSCTGSDVDSILRKKQVVLDDFTMEITAEDVDTYPKVFTKIHIEYVFTGSNIQERDIERAIDLSQNKYCPISAMLKKSCEINYSYKIIKKEKKED